jgi:TfoX/Sxy family transcriptional regulator of competence genes
MSHPPTTAEERFAMIVSVLGGTPGVTWRADDCQAKQRFGEAGLKVGGKIFALLVRGRLVVKLPRQRVEALVVAGDGERFEPRHDGRRMKEWVAVEPTSPAEWLALAREALEFVAAKR